MPTKNECERVSSVTMVVDLIHEALSVKLRTVARAERHRCSSWCEGARSNEEDGGGLGVVEATVPGYFTQSSQVTACSSCSRLRGAPYRRVVSCSTPSPHVPRVAQEGRAPLVAQVAKSPISASRVLLWPRVSRTAGEGRAQHTTRGPISLCQIIGHAHCAARERDNRES